MTTDVTSPLGAKLMLAVPGPPRPSFSLHDAAITPHFAAAALAALASKLDVAALAVAVGTGATAGAGDVPRGLDAVAEGTALALALGWGSAAAGTGSLGGSAGGGGAGSALGGAEGAAGGADGAVGAIASALGAGLGCFAPRFRKTTSPPAPAKSAMMARMEARTSVRPLFGEAGPSAVSVAWKAPIAGTVAPCWSACCWKECGPCG